MIEATRERLPDRRASETFLVEVMGLTFTVTVSRFGDDRLAELFITNHRAGSAAGIMASDAAIAASLGMSAFWIWHIMNSGLPAAA